MKYSIDFWFYNNQASVLLHGGGGLPRQVPAVLHCPPRGMESPRAGHDKDQRYHVPPPDIHRLQNTHQVVQETLQGAVAHTTR